MNNKTKVSKDSAEILIELPVRSNWLVFYEQ